MARPVYSRLFLAVDLDGPSIVPFVLPDESTYVIRDVTWTLQSAADVGARLVLDTDIAPQWYTFIPRNAADSDHIEVRWVAPGPLAGTITLTGAGALATFRLSGYELTP